MEFGASKLFRDQFKKLCFREPTNAFSVQMMNLNGASIPPHSNITQASHNRAPKLIQFNVVHPLRRNGFDLTPNCQCARIPGHLAHTFERFKMKQNEGLPPSTLTLGLEWILFYLSWTSRKMNHLWTHESITSNECWDWETIVETWSNLICFFWGQHAVGDHGDIDVHEGMNIVWLEPHDTRQQSNPLRSIWGFVTYPWIKQIGPSQALHIQNWRGKVCFFLCLFISTETKSLSCCFSLTENQVAQQFGDVEREAFSQHFFDIRHRHDRLVMSGWKSRF